MKVTTFEQSKHLLELGLKAETADLFYDVYVNPITKEKEGEALDFVCNWQNAWGNKRDLSDFFDDRTIPAWSLDAMLEMMPEITLWKQEDVKGWTAEYRIDLYTKRMISCDTPFKATYEMLCELLEKGIIKLEA